MSRPLIAFTSYEGLAGCYMPDSYGGAQIFARRGDLVSALRYELEFHDYPKACIRQADIRRCWPAIMRHGASVHSFTFYHKGRCLVFRGLTQAEFDAVQLEEAA